MVIPELRQGVANTTEARPLPLVMIKSNNIYVQFMRAVKDTVMV